MVFKPGESGNAGGKTRELAAYQSAVKLRAASHADEVVGYLLKVLRSEDEATATRLKAGCEILNRGLGLPAASLDVDILVKRQIGEMSLAELAELEARLSRAVLQLIEGVVEEATGDTSD